MTLADITAVMSRVGRANPALLQDRAVQLFIEAVIEEARKLPAGRSESPPLAPVDLIDV